MDKQNCDKVNIVEAKTKYEYVKENMNVVQTRSKNTEFTIEHILNRAGPTKKIASHPQYLSVTKSPITCPTDISFKWLTCTRYHPPKLTRPQRSMPARRTPGRLPRIPFSPTQLRILEHTFADTPYLSSHQAATLARSLQLTDTRVKIWFQNRRARARREPKNNVVSSTSLSPENITSNRFQEQCLIPTFSRTPNQENEKSKR